MARIETRHDLSTKQGIFDHVAEAIILQGKPSFKLIKNEGSKDDNVSCLYRAPDGCKCAAGHLIPNSEYDAKIEGRRVSTGEVEAKLDERIDRFTNGNFLAVLQRAHDDWAQMWPHDRDLTRYRYNMERVAANNDLSTAILYA